MITILIDPTQILQLNSFSGNLDVDTVKWFIFTAQNDFLKPMIGLELYNKLVLDYENDALAGDYLYFYENLVSRYLSYKASALYVNFSPFKVSNNGVHKFSAESITNADINEVEKLSFRYDELAQNTQNEIIKYLSEVGFAEFTASTESQTTNTMPWLL